MKKICHLPMLHSLDLGLKPTFFLHIWLLKRIEASLTYLRVTTSTIITITQLMSCQPLRHTLKQFHVKLSDASAIPYPDISCTRYLPRMEALHTFTFVKSFQWHFKEEWTVLDIFSSSNVMPILRRINFSIVIDMDDLYQMNRSSLFTDYRHVDVHYAFIVNDTESQSELLKYVPSGSQSYPRQIAGASFISRCYHNDQPLTTSNQQYVSDHLNL